MAVTLRPTMMRRLAGPIAAVVFLGFGAWFAFDAFWNPDKQRPAKVFDLWFNRVGAVVCPLLMIYAIFHTVRTARQNTSLDEEGITTESGQTIPLANITEIDDSTYDDDGYVRIGYKDAEGKLQTLILDGQRFDGVDDMLDELFDATGLASKATKPPEAEEPAAEEKPKDAAKSDADAEGAEPEEKAADPDEGSTG